MKLDRELQLALMRALSDEYPAKVEVDRLLGLHEDERLIHATLNYLAEHGLCVALARGTIGSPEGELLMAKITAAGLDFLAADGGLSAILRTVTVRLEADQLRQLIGARVEADPTLSAQEKSAIKTALAKLPEEAMKALIGQLLKQGLDHLPQGLAALRSLVGL